MDEPKRFWAWVPPGEWVPVYLASDYDALRAERDRLQKQADTWREMNQGYRKQLTDIETERDALRSRLAVLTVALTQVLPEKMGGTPDLFSPEGGWDKWEEKARSALGDVGDVRERVARMLLGISDFYVEWDSRPEDEKQRWRADADCLLAAIAMLPKEVRP